MRSSGTRICSSERASLSTGIIFCIKASCLDGRLTRPRAAPPSQIHRVPDHPAAFVLAEAKLHGESSGLGAAQAGLHVMMRVDAGGGDNFVGIVEARLYCRSHFCDLA